MILQVEIPKRSSNCFKGGESLLPGTEYYSAISPIENENLCQRHDYCPVCWKQMNQSENAYTSSWKSIVPQKKVGSELPKRRDDRALYLLKEALCDPDNTQAVAEAFVLALYLARRRLIFLRHEMKREGKVPMNLYEIGDTEEMLCVPKIPLSDLEVEKLQQELAKKFNAK